MVVASLRGDCWDRNRISFGSIFDKDISYTTTRFRLFRTRRCRRPSPAYCIGRHTSAKRLLEILPMLLVLINGGGVLSG
jgi:hypothetical protein